MMEIARKLNKYSIYVLKAIENRLKLQNPIYSETAAYGHMGRTPRIVKHFASRYEGNKEMEVELLLGKLDFVVKLKKNLV